MVVVLGLVLTGSVLSGPAKVQEGNYEANPDNPAASVPSLVASQGQALLAARLGVLGGRDDVEMSWLRVAEPDVGQNLCLLWQEEALDAGQSRPAFLVCGECRLFGSCDDFARQDAVRVASERVVAAEATPSTIATGITGLAGQPPSPDLLSAPKEVIDAERGSPTAVAGAVGELWLISHYTAGANFGGTSYPFGSPTASGIPAQPGVVACGSSYLGEAITIAGWDMLCADTGNPYYVYDGVADIWCEETPGFWGPTDPLFVVSTSPIEYAKDQWWYGLPCPAPCEWQDETGRCFAQATVINDADRP